MHDYRLADVQRILGISGGVLRALIRQRYVMPVRGRRREYRFSFQDLVALRTARALSTAGLSGRKIARSLRELRRHLPGRLPSSGLSIRAIGERLIVREGLAEWDSASGQYVLAFDVARRGEDLQVIDRITTRPTGSAEATDSSAAAEELFAAALQLEDSDAPAAARLYRRCLGMQAAHGAARINLARLLHQVGDLAEAERLYRHASCLTEAVARFNLAVLLEDAGRHAEAIESYAAAISVDPQMADAHYNLARLYELQGKAAHTIRHLRMYRTLAGKPTR